MTDTRVDWWFINDTGILKYYERLLLDSPDQREKLLDRCHAARRRNRYMAYVQLFRFPNKRTLVLHASLGVRCYSNFTIAISALMLRGMCSEIWNTDRLYTEEM